MTDSQPKSPPPAVPNIQQCPQCGNNILIGDRRCSRCGYNVSTLNETLRDFTPRYVLLVGGSIAFVLLLVGFSLEGTARAVTLFLAFLVGGGVWLYFVGMTYIFNDPLRRRRKLR